MNVKRRRSHSVSIDTTYCSSSAKRKKVETDCPSSSPYSQLEKPTYKFIMNILSETMDDVASLGIEMIQQSAKLKVILKTACNSKAELDSRVAKANDFLNKCIKNLDIFKQTLCFRINSSKTPETEGITSANGRKRRNSVHEVPLTGTRSEENSPKKDCGTANSSNEPNAGPVNRKKFNLSLRKSGELSDDSEEDTMVLDNTALTAKSKRKSRNVELIDNESSGSSNIGDMLPKDNAVTSQDILLLDAQLAMFQEKNDGENSDDPQRNNSDNSNNMLISDIKEEVEDVLNATQATDIVDKSIYYTAVGGSMSPVGETQTDSTYVAPVMDNLVLCEKTGCFIGGTVSSDSQETVSDFATCVDVQSNRSSLESQDSSLVFSITVDRFPKSPTLNGVTNNETNGNFDAESLKMEVDVEDVKLFKFECLGKMLPPENSELPVVDNGTNDMESFDESEASDDTGANENAVHETIEILKEDFYRISSSEDTSSCRSTSPEANLPETSAEDVPGKIVDVIPEVEDIDDVFYEGTSDGNAEEEEKIASAEHDNKIGDDLVKKHNLRPCCVVLTNAPSSIEKFFKVVNEEESFQAKELKEIERLTNLDSLDKKRVASNGTVKHRSKKLKKNPKSNDVLESDNSSYDSDGDTTRVSCTPEPVSNFDTATSEYDTAANILKYTGLNDTELDSSGKESDGEEEGDGRVKTKKRKKREKNMQEVDADKQKIIEEKEKGGQSDSDWKNDPLLTERFSNPNNDSNGKKTDDNVGKRDKKINKPIMGTILNSPINSPVSRNDESDDSDSYNPSIEGNSSDSSSSFSLEESSYCSDFKNDKQQKKPKVKSNSVTVVSTDSDNSIKYMGQVKDSGSKSKKVIDISSDDSDITSGSPKKKGRKNIRALLPDETLEESTKRAKEEEEIRKKRLTRKKITLDNFLSSSTLCEEDGMVLDADSETNKTLVMVHPRLKKRLKQHQVDGVRFMWDSCYESVKQMQVSPGSGCILAHCMGLGKTFQIVTLVHTLFAHEVTNTRHVLVVCPLSTVLNWANEFKIGLASVPDINFRVFTLSERHKDPTKRNTVIMTWATSKGVLIMGYEAFQRAVREKENSIDVCFKEALEDPGPDLIICDEGHLLKNGKNNRTRALMKVRTKRRIILTGTPLQNNLDEYYHMVQFVKPNLLGSFSEYSNRFVNPIMNGQYDDSTKLDITLMKKRSHVLHKILKGTVQRYEESELESYLPEKLDYVLFVQLHPLQAELYKTYVEGVRNREDTMKKKLFAHFHQLQVIWTHPYILHIKEKQKCNLEKKPTIEVDTINLDPVIKETDDLSVGWWHNICTEEVKTCIAYGPKFMVMRSIIEESEKIGDKLLIFSSSLAELDAIEYFLKLQGTASCPTWTPQKDYCRMDGTVAPDSRIELCNRFNDKSKTKLRVFLVSHRVGGLGLNLVAANRVILMDVNWNPAYDSQSIFRIYRFGQEKACYVYRLISMGTMEEVIYERSVTKSAIAGRVVDEMQISRHYKSDDLQKMYRFDVDLNRERPTPNLPADAVLANLLQKHEKEIFKYHEHQALLENLPEEELNEDEMRVAWDEFNKENEGNVADRQAGTSGTSNRKFIIPPGWLAPVNANTSAVLNRANTHQLQNVSRNLNRASIEMKQHRQDLLAAASTNSPQSNDRSRLVHLTEKVNAHVIHSGNAPLTENRGNTNSPQQKSATPAGQGAALSFPGHNKSPRNHNVGLQRNETLLKFVKARTQPEPKKSIPETPLVTIDVELHELLAESGAKKKTVINPIGNARTQLEPKKSVPETPLVTIDVEQHELLADLSKNTDITLSAIGDPKKSINNVHKPLMRQLSVTDKQLGDEITITNIVASNNGAPRDRIVPTKVPVVQNSCTSADVIEID